MRDFRNGSLGIYQWKKTEIIMENRDLNIQVESLRRWLDEGQNIFVLDVRPDEQRAEWHIPGSYHIDAYSQLKEGNAAVLDQVNIPDNTKVITVCAAGKTSQIAAEALRNNGIEAYSLEGGMKNWSLAWNTAESGDSDVEIIQVRRTGKGCLSYVVGSENEAIVVDASLEPELYLEIAAKKGWAIKYVLDTHIHADHLSRSLSLSKLSGADLILPDQDKVKFAFKKIKDQDALQFGNASLNAIHTPGHTSDSTSYLISGKYMLTGDTLFTNGVGRPDLKATEEEAKARASLLYKSLQKILKLDENILVLPGHISKPVPFDHLIIGEKLGEIKKTVDSLNLSEEEFVTVILSRIPPTPPNYLKVAELNLTGNFNGVDPKELEAGANRCAVS